MLLVALPIRFSSVARLQHVPLQWLLSRLVQHQEKRVKCRSRSSRGTCGRGRAVFVRTHPQLQRELGTLEFG